GSQSARTSRRRSDPAKRRPWCQVPASGEAPDGPYMFRADRIERSFWGPGTMIYILAVFIPPLALLLNGQLFSAIINFVMIVPCLLLGFVFPVLWLVPSGHAVIAIYMSREDRKHREIVDAIE